MLKFRATKATSTCSLVYQGLLSPRPDKSRFRCTQLAFSTACACIPPVPFRGFRFIGTCSRLVGVPIHRGPVGAGGLRGVRRGPLLRVLHSLFTKAIRDWALAQFPLMKDWVDKFLHIGLTLPTVGGAYPDTSLLSPVPIYRGFIGDPRGLAPQHFVGNRKPLLMRKS